MSAELLLRCIRIALDRFKAVGWQTISVDYVENKDAHINSPLDTTKNWQENTELVLQRLGKLGFAAQPSRSQRSRFAAMAKCMRSFTRLAAGLAVCSCPLTDGAAENPMLQKL